MTDQSTNDLFVLWMVLVLAGFAILGAVVWIVESARSWRRHHSLLRNGTPAPDSHSSIEEFKRIISSR